MARLKLVSNVSEFGLFRSVARTRGRLIAAAALVSAVMVGAGLFSTHYIIEQSSSVGLNIVIITALMIVVMLASYLQALLIGDLFFKGPWREQVILGERTWKTDPDADVVVSNHNAEFMIVLILLVIGNALLLNFSGGGFLDRYHEEGFFLVRMRSDDPSERLAALRDMSDPTQYELWENGTLRTLIVDTLAQDQDSTVRAQAAWNAGIMKIRPAQKALIAIVEDATQSVEAREEAAVALGRLGPDEAARRAMERALTGSKPEERDLKLAMLRGLGMLAMQGSHEVILPIARDADDEELMIYALWALQRTQSPEARAWVKQTLSDETPEEGKRLCALLDAMKMLSKPEDVSWARKEFLGNVEDTTCERVVWEERDERLHTILFSDTLRTKYMKIVANSGDGTRYRTWFETIAHDPSQEWSLREAAAAIVKQIDRAGLH